MQWWTWIIAGMALLGIELFAPFGLYLILIGVACLVTGFLVFLGVLPGLSAQLTVAGIVGIILLFTARRPLSSVLGALGRKSGSRIEAQRVKILDEVPPSSTGRGELSGTPWSIRNETGDPLERGSVYSVEKVEGLTLVVTSSKKLS